MASEFSLESEDYESIRNRAVQSIIRYQRDWTNYNTADTGIALLELLSWMQEMQQFYLERYGVEHELLFLELLGMKPKELTPASVLVHVSLPSAMQRNGNINKNTGFVTEHLRFEPNQRGMVGTEELQMCYAETREGRSLWRSRKGEAISHGVWLFGEQPKAGTCFYLGFDQPFLPNCRHSMYLELELPEGAVRNPISDAGKNLFSRYRLEYFNGFRWMRCKMIQDETAGFLQSGFIDWMAEGEQAEVNRLFWLRFRLLTCAFDVPPRFLEADTHRIRLLQKETITASEQIVLPVQESGIYHIIIEEYFDEPEELAVFVKSGADYCKVEYKLLQHGTLEFRYLEREDTFLTVLLVIYPSHKDILTNWEATGFPNQSMELGDRHIMGSRLRVLVETERNSGIFRFWNPSAHFREADSTSECYCFQETTGQLWFGDGDHGVIPEGRIYLADCVRTYGLDGTIQAGKQFQWRNGTAYNSVAAKPGSQPESGQECRERFRQQMQEPSRAVTAKDYEALVKQTPGLIIKRVKAIRDAQAGNCMTLVIEGGGKQAGALSPIYRREIRTWLEGKRILGTQLKLEPPVYIPIRIQAEITVYERFRQAEAWIREALEDYIRIQMEEFGAGLNYSHLYGTLDGLSCVAEINGLTVTASGKGILFQRDGGFRLPERGLAVLEELQLQLRSDSRR